MLKHKARSIEDLKIITYGYAGCPVSVRDNNYNIIKNLGSYLNSKKNQNDKNNIEYIKEFFSVFYR